MKAISKKYRLPATIGGIILLAIVCAGLFMLVERYSPGDLNDVENITKKVSRHVLVPRDEEPALLTVTDPSKLKTEFLKQTKNGDKVLVYQKNKKAIIYRPDVDKIVDIGPVVIDAIPINNGE